MHEQLGQFVEAIMSLGPGGRWPNSGGDITQRLKQSTMQLAAALQEPGNSSRSQLQTLAQDIESLLLAEQTVNGWGQAETDRLIDALHNLTGIA